MKHLKKKIIYLSIIASAFILFSGCKEETPEPVKTDPVITWDSPDDIQFGITLDSTQLNATANVPGSFEYTPSVGSKLEIGDDQILKVDFIPSDLNTYNKVSKTVLIDVDQFGTMTDQEGNIYKTIIIGTQTWMAENLRTAKYRDGTTIDYVTNNATWGALSTGAYCWFDNNEGVYKYPYGALYNWYAVNDSRNIAPQGWHVPTDAEWAALIDYLGGSSVAGGKLKEQGTGHWSTPNTDATNESGFTGIPVSYRSFEGIYSPGSFLKGAYWWAATSLDSQHAPYYGVNYTSGSSVRLSWDKLAGFSVRCIKD